MGDRGSKDGHLAEALAILDEIGLPAGFQLFTAQGLAQAIGVHRSTLYRHWETSAELNDDLLRWGALERTGWQRRLIAQDPAQPFETSVEVALETVTHELSIGARAAILGYPDRAVTWEVIDAERLWLEALGWWMGEHLAAHGRRPAGTIPPFDVGLAIACVIEGQLVLGALHGGALLEGWKPEHTELITFSASSVLRELTEEGTRRDAPTERPELPRIDGWPPARRSLAARMSDAINTMPFGTIGSPEAARMVDFRMLSRRTGVSARHLYALWPAAEDFNADLVELVTVRHRSDGEENASQALATGLQQPGVDVTSLIIGTAEAIVLGGSRPGRATPFACVSAMSHAVPRARGSSIIDESMQRQQVAALAMLQTFGYDIRPPLDVARFVRVLYGVVTGAQRLALSHPELRERWVPRVGGGEVRSLAVPLGLVLAACTERR